MKTSRILTVLFIAIIALLSSCKKDDLNDLVLKPAVTMHVDTGAVSVSGDPVSPNSGGPSSTSSNLIMVRSIGAKFHLSYGDSGKCLLRFDACGPQPAVFSSSIAQQSDGNYPIYPNAATTFTVAASGGSMIFQVHNLALDTAQITFVTSGVPTINPAANNNVYPVPVNGNVLLIVSQIRPWLASATPSPTNPN